MINTAILVFDLASFMVRWLFSMAIAIAIFAVVFPVLILAGTFEWLRTGNTEGTTRLSELAGMWISSTVEVVLTCGGFFPLKSGK